MSATPTNTTPMRTAPTTHPVTPEDLMALLDGELPTDRVESVSVHADSCDACGRLLQDLRQSGRSIGAWQVSSASASLGAGIESAAASTFGSLGHPRLPLKRQRSRKKWAIGLGLAATALLFSFFTAIPNRLRSKPEFSNYSDKALATGAAQVGGGRGNGYGPALEAKTSRSQNQPLNGRGSNSLVTQSFGATADSKGLFHGLGDHAQNSFSVDGQPRSEQQGRIFSGPMIARSVSLAILVKDFDFSRKSLDAILARYSGYSANLTVNTPQGASRMLNASLRIPASQLPAALAELKSLGHVENESQNGEEVSQQHADLVARLKNSRETEQRLQAILTQRTGKISDVLEVEQEIARVRGEVEQMEAEQKNLEHRVDFATIDLSLSEEYKAKLDSAVPSFSTQFHNALVNGYRNVAGTLSALVLFFAEYGPVLVFWVLLSLATAWLARRRWRQATVAL
jgi:anti-sigma factor RsiW